jgi:hypothetical protein
MDVVCCDIRVVSSRKRRGERVGVGSRGKYPGAPPHHKGKRNQADRKRYLIGLLGEKGKAKKKKNIIFCSTLSEFENFLLCERILINVTTCQNETSS